MIANLGQGYIQQLLIPLDLLVSVNWAWYRILRVDVCVGARLLSLAHCRSLQLPEYLEQDSFLMLQGPNSPGLLLKWIPLLLVEILDMQGAMWEFGGKVVRSLCWSTRYAPTLVNFF
jgi:hypothetical protein